MSFLLFSEPHSENSSDSLTHLVLFVSSNGLKKDRKAKVLIVTIPLDIETALRFDFGSSRNSAPHRYL